MIEGISVISVISGTCLVYKLKTITTHGLGVMVLICNS